MNEEFYIVCVYALELLFESRGGGGALCLAKGLLSMTLHAV